MRRKIVLGKNLSILDVASNSNVYCMMVYSITHLLFITLWTFLTCQLEKLWPILNALFIYCMFWSWTWKSLGKPLQGIAELNHNSISHTIAYIGKHTFARYRWVNHNRTLALITWTFYRLNQDSAMSFNLYTCGFPC